MSFRGLSESDRIRRKKGAATYVNFATLLGQQSGCSISGCTATNCIIRYPTYEYRQTVDSGAAECTGCTCLADIDAATGNTGAAAWATFLNATGISSVLMIKLDNLGNIYLVGNYNSSSSVTIKNVNGTTQSNSLITLPSTSSKTAGYILKYNSSGQAQWATCILGDIELLGNSLVLDSNSNIYICGRYSSTTTVTLQNASGNSQTSSSVTLPLTTSLKVWGYLCKYDLNGQAQWAVNFAPEQNAIFPSLAIDTNSNLYIVGAYVSSSLITLKNNNFTGGQTNSSITLPVSSSNDRIFLLKYNSSGIAQWATYLSTGLFDLSGAYSIAVDKNSNDLYFVGSYANTNSVTLKNANGNSQIDSSVTLPIINGGSVVIKYTSNGIAIWASYIENTNQDSSQYIQIDSNSNIYVQIGAKNNLIVYNAYLNTQSISNLIFLGIGSESNIATLIKFNNEGLALWGTYLQVNGIPGGIAINNNNIYIVGYYSDTASFNLLNVNQNSQSPSSITLPGASAIGFTAYIIKYNLDGLAQWATYLPSISLGIACANDLSGNLFFGGQYNSTGFNIPIVSGTSQTNSSITLPTSTGFDFFLIKYI